MDWESSNNEVLINPRMHEEEQHFIRSGLSNLNAFFDHIWVSTSGSTGKLKWVALSKQAILSSAKAVNQHLNSDANAKDIWLNPLPRFHVGGVGIIARCHMSGARFVNYIPENGKWNCGSFVEQLNTHQITLTSLVPTQVYDLVKGHLSPPKSLRAIVVGGGALSEQLYFRARELGWNLLPSYGMTECASQIATASLDSLTFHEFPELVPLSHVNLRINAEDFLEVKSPSLLSAYAYEKEGEFRLVDPKVEGWFVSEDRVKLENGKLSGISRGSHFIKIGGESVNLLSLEAVLESVLLKIKGDRVDVALVPMKDERLGHVLNLITTSKEERWNRQVVDKFNQKVMPFERIREVKYVDIIPRSPLGKRLS